MRSKKRPLTIKEVLASRDIPLDVRVEAWKLWKNDTMPEKYRKPWKHWKELFLED